VIEGPLRFDAVLKLEDYRLPADARISVEAYRQTTWMRFDFGIVSAITPPADRRLTEFDTTEGLLFRVKVTAARGAAGRLLAVAEQLPFTTKDTEGATQPLLPVKPQDLGSEIYRLDHTGARPILLINKQIGDWRQLARSPAFVCLSYPQMLREILTRILCIDEYHEIDEDDDDWRAQWLRFASRLPGSSAPPPDDTDESRLDDWINDAVAGFARSHGMADRFRLHWSEGALS
jgi:hypothetical protein